MADPTFPTLSPRASAPLPGPPPATEQGTSLEPDLVLLGSWTVDYVVGPGNGNGANITIPLHRLDRRTIKPGASFDFWTALGEVSLRTGYRRGAIIVGHRIDPDGALAGGICTVSTALFNAAARAGLQITARRSHGGYLAKYPLGLDAAVAKGDHLRQTLAFRNDTTQPILIRTISTTGMARVDLYGVAPLGRTVEFSKPAISGRQKARDRHIRTTSLKRGEQRRIEDRSDGMTVVVKRTVLDADGQVLHRGPVGVRLPVAGRRARRYRLTLARATSTRSTPSMPGRYAPATCVSGTASCEHRCDATSGTSRQPSGAASAMRTTRLTVRPDTSLASQAINGPLATPACADGRPEAERASQKVEDPSMAATRIVEPDQDTVTRAASRFCAVQRRVDRDVAKRSNDRRRVVAALPRFNRVKPSNRRTRPRAGRQRVRHEPRVLGHHSVSLTLSSSIARRRRWSAPPARRASSTRGEPVPRLEDRSKTCPGQALHVAVQASDRLAVTPSASAARSPSPTAE